jgi:hypothetical protein
MKRNAKQEATAKAAKTLPLTQADGAMLQDAWHYAMMLVDREESTFAADSEYPPGVRGEMVAYERLLSKLDDLGRWDEEWDNNRNLWYSAGKYEQIVTNAKCALDSINAAADRLGICARTGDKRGLE